MIRCYEYGCLEPTCGLDAVLDQMRKRHTLGNQFVEIEREFRQKREDLLKVPEQEEAERISAELADLRKRLRAAKKKLPVKASGDDEVSKLAKGIKELERTLLQKAAILTTITDGTLAAAESKKDALKAVWASIKEKRRLRAVEIKEQLQQLNRDRIEAMKRAQTESGVHWLNSDSLRTEHETAHQNAMKSAAQLHFQKWAGATTKISLRWQRGLPVDQVFGGDSLLQIAPVDPLAFESPTRAVRRRLCRTTLRFRVCALNSRKELIQAEVPVFLHRPLPLDGMIRTAALIREPIADRFRWKLVLSVNMAEPKQRKGRAVTVSLQHIRPVALWRGYDEHSGALVLDERLIGNFQKCDELRSLIDQKFNTVRETLANWLKHQSIPDWLREETETLAQWRSPGRLRYLVDYWQRFRGDEMIFAALTAWRDKHVHLWEWKRNLEDQMVLARREAYRVFAAGLIKAGYRTLRITDRNLAEKKKRPEVETGRVVVAARTRDIAAHGVLRSVLRNAFLREGGKIEDCGDNSAEFQSAKNGADLAVSA